MKAARRRIICRFYYISEHDIYNWNNQYQPLCQTNQIVMASDYLSHKSNSNSNSTPLTPSHTNPALAPRSNVLSSKVSSLLSASYADIETRDALNLINERNIVNNAQTRRQLRLNVQREVIESNGVIIKEFGHVAEQLKRIGATIATLNRGCDEIRKHINAARQETAPILQEASEIMLQKQQIETKQQLLGAFNKHFIVSDDDIATLSSSAEPVNDHFFAVLAKTKKLQSDSEILLGAENQRLGLEIVEQVSKALNAAFQKLYRWVQREFKSLNLENPQISSSMRRALRVLAERPSLFQNCLDFFSKSRENTLSDTFYTALIGTSANGVEDPSIKPIELIAHDPLRYVGDMLAWTHSATVSEREALEVLFISEGDEIAKGIQAGRDSEPWMMDDKSSTFDGLRALNDLVDRNVTGVAKVLRQRIGQVISSHEEIIMAYKIANLLGFYRIMLIKLLGDDSVLLSTLSGLEETAMKQFRALMRDRIAGLRSDVHPAMSDLAPPEFLSDGMKELKAIMLTYDSSFTSSLDRESDFKSVMTEAFEPYMEKVNIMAKGLEPPSNAIFTINCVLVASLTLSLFDFTTDRLNKLQDDMRTQSAELISYQYGFLLTNSGIRPLLEATEPLSNSKGDLLTLLNSPALQSNALTEASQTLDDFLPSALMDATENLKALQSSKLAQEITEEAADRFCHVFESIEAKLTAADEILAEKEEETGRGGEVGEERVPLRVLFPRTRGEIRVLLT